MWLYGIVLLSCWWILSNTIQLVFLLDKVFYTTGGFQIQNLGHIVVNDNSGCFSNITTDRLFSLTICGFFIIHTQEYIYSLDSLYESVKEKGS